MKPETGSISDIPHETYQAVQEVYGIQNDYLQIGDHLDDILSPINLALLNPTGRLNSDTAFRLALISVFQYAESMPDQLASEASRKRLDWKYALHLPVRFLGISATALCAFRQNLFSSTDCIHEFFQLFNQISKFGLCTKLSDDSSNGEVILSWVCMATRLYRLKTAMRNAFGVLISMDPDWLRLHTLPHWYERYKTGSEKTSLRLDNAQMVAEANGMAVDIDRLLAVAQEQNSLSISKQPEIRVLSRLLKEQFFRSGRDLTWRLPRIASCTCSHMDERPAY